MSWRQFVFDINPKGEISRVCIIAMTEEEAMIRLLQQGYEIVHPKLDIVEQLIHSVNNE